MNGTTSNVTSPLPLTLAEVSRLEQPTNETASNMTLPLLLPATYVESTALEANGVNNASNATLTIRHPIAAPEYRLTEPECHACLLGGLARHSMVTPISDHHGNPGNTAWGGALMKDSGKSPKWRNRERFVLWNGHACALQYTMLQLAGYDVTAKDLSQFCQLGSKTSWHPASFVTDGIEVCTGPHGQGITNAGDELCPELEMECKKLGIGAYDEHRTIKYADIERLYFEIAIPWMVKLYAETMTCIHYSHDHAYYENIRMANPMHGRDKNGALSSVASVAKLPCSKYIHGISNTFCLLPNAVGQPADHSANLATLLFDRYSGHHGHHITINVLSRDVIQESKVQHDDASQPPARVAPPAHPPELAFYSLENPTVRDRASATRHCRCTQPPQPLQQPSASDTDDTDTEVTGLAICSIDKNDELYTSLCLASDALADKEIGNWAARNAFLDKCGCCDVSLEDGGELPAFCGGPSDAPSQVPTDEPSPSPTLSPSDAPETCAAELDDLSILLRFGIRPIRAEWTTKQGMPTAIIARTPHFRHPCDATTDFADKDSLRIVRWIDILIERDKLLRYFYCTVQALLCVRYQYIYWYCTRTLHFLFSFSTPYLYLPLAHRT
jgi:hypothetical protein